MVVDQHHRLPAPEASAAWGWVVVALLIGIVGTLAAPRTKGPTPERQRLLAMLREAEALSVSIQAAAPEAPLFAEPEEVEDVLDHYAQVVREVHALRYPDERGEAPGATDRAARFVKRYKEKGVWVDMEDRLDGLAHRAPLARIVPQLETLAPFIARLEALHAVTAPPLEDIGIPPGDVKGIDVLTWLSQALRFEALAHRIEGRTTESVNATLRGYRFCAESTRYAGSVLRSGMVVRMGAALEDLNLLLADTRLPEAALDKLSEDLDALRGRLPSRVHERRASQATGLVSYLMFEAQAGPTGPELSDDGVASVAGLQGAWRELTKFEADKPPHEALRAMRTYLRETHGGSHAARMLPESLSLRLEVATRLELTRAHVALLRFEAAHGKRPDRLEDLAPAFLPDLPRCALSGTPLHYDGRRVWASGEDWDDDGGWERLPDDDTPPVDTDLVVVLRPNTLEALPPLPDDMKGVSLREDVPAALAYAVLETDEDERLERDEEPPESGGLDEVEPPTTELWEFGDENAWVLAEHLAVLAGKTSSYTPDTMQRIAALDGALRESSGFLEFGFGDIHPLTPRDTPVRVRQVARRWLAWAMQFADASPWFSPLSEEDRAALQSSR